MVAEFLIFLREGLEGSMVVAILLAALRQTGQAERTREVWFGVGAALVVALGGGLAAFFILHSYDGTRVQRQLEGTTYFLAAAILTYTTFWMRGESRRMKGALTAEAARAIAQGGGLALAGLAFLTVAREGLETVVFSLAIALASRAWQVAVGAAVGLGLALAISRAMYAMGLRLDLGRFFSVMGVLLMVSAAGLLADGVEDYQALGWMPRGHGPLWHTGAIVPEGGFVGDLLHTFLGYAQSPTLLQVAAYVLYLAVVLSFWLVRRTGRPSGAAVG